MTRLRLPLALLAAGVTAGAVAAPAHADFVTIGSDLSKPATVAMSDPNDIFFWSADGPAGVAVPVQGEIRAIKVKGGTVQSAEQTKNAEAFDPKYDIVHWVVIRPQGDGTWRSVATSEDLEAPVLGRDGVTEDTVTTMRQPKDEYRVCAKPGDRVALATVGGYVPTADGAGRPIAGFQNGLPYQMFARSSDHSIDEFRAGGQVDENKTVITGKKQGGVELLMQAVVGTGNDARFTCQTAEEQKGAAGPSGGSKPAKPLVPMATPLLKARRLTKKGTVPINLTCRAAGTDCAGTIELRAHKTRIGFAKYALLKGASGVFDVKLTSKGKRFVKVASAKKLRTAVVVTATGGRKASGIFSIRPAKK